MNKQSSSLLLLKYTCWHHIRVWSLGASDIVHYRYTAQNLRN